MSNNLVINHNLTALNIIGQINLHQTSLNKSIAHLSSSLRINSAADDAAGLSISQRMRGQLAVLKQAGRNAQDGISFIQTAEGSLGEVHDMLTRMEKLTVQAANDTYSEVDKKNIQAEIDELKKAINHISGTTKFNGINAFKSSGSGFHLNLTSIKVGSNYATNQTPRGNYAIAGYDPDFVNQLETEIVPNAVKSLLSAYPALGYLADSSIGIGLSLYNNPSSTTLATAYNTYTYNSNKEFWAAYNLEINMAAVNWDSATNTITNRSKVESVIAHEMTHALMYETVTVGMIGLDSNFNATAEYPNWFVEGFAQAASGPGNWLSSLSSTSSDTSIKNLLSKLPTNTNLGNYGSGYLATTYLGHLASGSAGPATASSILTGLNNILSSLISGKSLNDIIKYNTTYNGLDEYTTSLQNDTQIYDFVRTVMSQKGSGLGSVITGNLNATDVVDDNKLTLNLFKLNPNSSYVQNGYTGTNINPLSGGGVYSTGVSPNSTPSDSGSSNPTPPITVSLNGINFKIGEGADEVITYDVPTLDTKTLGIDNLNVLTNPDTASIKEAIEKVSTIRSHLGALQNRLEHSYNNIVNMEENLTAAESRIRDTDMAKEMLEFSKNNILVQVGMTLLAQANSMQNNVLQLLR